MSEEEAKAQSSNRQMLQLDMDAQTALGKYANFSVVAHTHGEFVIDFAGYLPGIQKPRVVSRIILNPKSAKGLANALMDNVQRYEDQHGEIAVGNAQQNPPTLN